MITFLYQEYELVPINSTLHKQLAETLQAELRKQGSQVVAVSVGSIAFLVGLTRPRRPSGFLFVTTGFFRVAFFLPTALRASLGSSFSANPRT
jgi:hypothetical protein